MTYVCQTVDAKLYYTSYLELEIYSWLFCLLKWILQNTQNVDWEEIEVSIIISNSTAAFLRPPFYSLEVLLRLNRGSPRFLYIRP